MGGLQIGTTLFLVGLVVGLVLILGGGTSSATVSSVSSITTITELKEVIRKSDKPVLVKVTADWCVYCKKVEKDVLGTKEVQEVLSKYNVITIDVTKTTTENQRLLRELGVLGLPAALIYKAGNTDPIVKLVGYSSVSDIKAYLERIAQGE